MFLCIVRIISYFVVFKFTFNHTAVQGNRFFNSQERFDKYYKKRGFSHPPSQNDNADLFIKILKKKTILDQQAKVNSEKRSKNNNFLMGLVITDFAFAPFVLFHLIIGRSTSKAILFSILFGICSFLVWKGWEYLFTKLNIQSHFFFDEYRYDQLSFAAEETSMQLMEQNDDELYLESFELVEIASNILGKADEQLRNVYLFIMAFWAIIILASF